MKSGTWGIFIFLCFFASVSHAGDVEDAIKMLEKHQNNPLLVERTDVTPAVILYLLGLNQSGQLSFHRIEGLLILTSQTGGKVVLRFQWPERSDPPEVFPSPKEHSKQQCQTVE